MKDKQIINRIYKKFNDSFFPMHDPNRTELTNPNWRENPHLIFVRVTSNLAGSLEEFRSKSRITQKATF
jgi:hypothetical protein